MEPRHRFIRRAVFLSGCAASIGSLLSHLGDGPRMSFWAVAVFPVAIAAMVFAWRWGVKAGDEDFLVRIRAGLVGGLLGTIGYDVVRIPFDIVGSNTLAPIRVYGVWLTASESSTVWTDLAGFGYHVSNGVTFGWMFSMVLIRRHWMWAVIWGLLLESLAVLSAFGEVFAIRQANYSLLLAYAGHVFYGVPLGLYCQRPERLKTWPLFSKPALVTGVVGNAAVCLWFVLFLFAGWTKMTPGTVSLGPDSVHPTWRDVPSGTPLSMRNQTDASMRVMVRTPSESGHRIVEHEVGAGQTLEITPEYPGIYQIQAADRDWRSVFFAVHRDGSYRAR